jgi:hypothetical protein
MTGTLAIRNADPWMFFQKTAGTGHSCALWGQVDTAARWTLVMINGDAETGGNTGSNFQIDRWDDSGGNIGPALTINRATGNIGIGTATPGSKFTVAGSIALPSDNFIGFTGTTAVSASNYTLFANAGNTLLNAPTGDIRLRLNNVDALAVDATGLTASGNAYKPGGGPWTATSDARIKDVLGNYTPGLAEVLQLKPVRYTFKGNYSKKPDGPSPHQRLAEEKKEFVGLIAQQAEVPMPEMVTVEAGYINGDPVDDLRVLDTTALVFALVNACKELAARVAALEQAA